LMAIMELKHKTLVNANLMAYRIRREDVMKQLLVV
jgi:hypothetical protein